MAWHMPGVIASALHHSELPVFDLTPKKQEFLTYRRRIRPLGPPTGLLAFSRWRLAHAIKKAEWTRYTSPIISHFASLGFLVENGHMFDRNTANLRLAEDAISLLDDFSRTALAGRIAQGLSLLYMENAGYTFVARFSSFCRSAGVQIPAKSATPDYVCEKAPADRALVEAKGGFVGAADSADIKQPIASALGQLSNWGQQFSPSITKKFAVASFLREVNDPHPEPSLTVVVDPEGESGDGGRHFPEDAIRRANYAAWLRGMGYVGAAQKLLGEAREPYRATFRVVLVGSVPHAVMPYPAHHLRSVGSASDVFFLVNGWRHDLRVPVVGIRLETLRKVAAASAHPGSTGLFDIVPQDAQDRRDESQDGTLGSSFADGSFFGAVSFSSFESAGSEALEF
jgi:hypothetical protein